MAPKSDPTNVKKLLSVERLSLFQMSSFSAQVVDEANKEYLLGSLLAFGFLVQPRIDKAHLERVINRLARRHESLRQKFVNVDGKWKVEIWDRHPTGVCYKQYGEVSDKKYLDILEEHSLTPIRIETDVPIQFLVLQFGALGDVLIVKADHCNVDGHSLVIFAEEMIKLLVGFPLFGKPITHRQYLEKYESPRPARVAQIKKYWRSIVYPVLPSPSSGCFGTGSPIPRRIFEMETYRSRSHSIGKSEYDRFNGNAAKRGLTPFAYLLAGFSKSYLQLSELSGMYVTTAIDRHERELSHQIACLVKTIPVRCEFDADLDVATIGKSLSKQINDSINFSPSELLAPESHYDFDVYDEGGVLKTIFCAVILPEARVSRSPFATSLHSTAPKSHKIGQMTITKLDLPVQSTSPASLAFYIVPEPERAVIHINYHTHLFDESDISAILDRIEINLDLNFTNEPSPR